MAVGKEKTFNELRAINQMRAELFMTLKTESNEPNFMVGSAVNCVIPVFSDLIRSLTLKIR